MRSVVVRGAAPCRRGRACERDGLAADASLEGDGAALQPGLVDPAGGAEAATGGRDCGDLRAEERDGAGARVAHRRPDRPVGRVAGAVARAACDVSGADGSRVEHAAVDACRVDR
jgi:hypothetical protein